METVVRVAAAGLFIALGLQACDEEPTPHWATALNNLLRVTVTDPSEGAASVPIDTDVRATLSAELDPTSVTASSLTLTQNGDPVAGTVALSDDGKTVTFAPAAPLERIGSFRATLSNVTGLDGRSLASTTTWSFTTADRVWSPPQAVALQERRFSGNSISKVAVDPQGNAFVVWDLVDETGDRVWANRYTASDGWGTPESLEGESEDARLPNVVASPDGGALAVWVRFSSGPESDAGIWSNRFTLAQGWGPAEPLQLSPAAGVFRPDLAIDSQGRALAVWGGGGTGKIPWASWYIPSEGWGAPEALAADQGAVFNEPQVAIGEEQNAVVIWEQSDAPESQSIRVSRHTSAGGWGAPEAIEGENPGPVDSFNEFRVAMDPAGSAIAVWERWIPFEAEPNKFMVSIWTNRTAPSGDWGTAELLETGEGSAGEPRIVMDADGNGLAVWRQFDGMRSRLVSRRYTPSDGWSEEELAEQTSSGTPRRSDLAIGPNGNAILVWQNEMSDSDIDLWTNRYTPSLGWGNGQVMEKGEDSPTRFPSVAIGVGGDAAVAWTQYEGSDDKSVGIWASTFD